MTWQDPQAVQKFQAAEEVLRRQGGARTLAVCRRCGVLPWNTEFGNWAALAAAAQGHADSEGKGHVIVASFVQGELFRPQAAESTSTP